jgi:hypothetical protein
LRDQNDLGPARDYGRVSIDEVAKRASEMTGIDPHVGLRVFRLHVLETLESACGKALRRFPVVLHTLEACCCAQNQSLQERMLHVDFIA